MCVCELNFELPNLTLFALVTQMRLKYTEHRNSISNGNYWAYLDYRHGNIADSFKRMLIRNLDLECIQ